MITSLLKNAYEQKKLVDINIYDPEDEDSVIGYITEVNDECFTIKEINRYGNADGSTIYNVDRIKNISLDNWYLRNLQIIIDNHNKLNRDNRVTIHKNGKELDAHFKNLKEKEIMTMLFFNFKEDDFELGIILDYDEDCILFKRIGEDGYELGITCYRLNDITGLRCNGLDEQRTQLLYDAFKDTGDKY